LHQAQQEAKTRTAELTRTHDSLEHEMEPMKSKKTALVQQAIALHASKSDPSEATAAALSYVRRLTLHQQDLADLDQRIQAEQKLDNVYGMWGTLVWNRELTSGNRLIRSAFWIVLIILLTTLTDSFFSRYFSGLTPDRNRLLTARSLLHFSLRALAVVLILIVLFGPPSQLATALALAGAGLTVALKDFVVGFFGWFVLMGRNGVRPGDWVEINGVQGKVMEVGLLHTVVLETGNWTDAGHPTGRKVTFVNSYAIEGHYFNYSTAGQWLWDEIQVSIRSGTDPYPTVEAIQKLVTAETEANAQLAEQEWRHATSTSGLHTISAAPAISVRPTDSGLKVIVRYITRADERDELRARIYRAIYEFLIGKNVLQPATEPPAPQPATARS
jgi:small-conductance mechanosensitive channel